MPLEPGTLEGMNMHLSVLGLPPLKEAWDNPPLARDVHNILTTAKPVLLARLAATTGAEIRTLAEELDYGTRNRQTLVHTERDRIRLDLLARFAALQQRAEEAERVGDEIGRTMCEQVNKLTARAH